MPEARTLAIEHRVLLLETPDGVPLDIALGGLPFEARMVERATPYAFAQNAPIVTCSAEDLTVLKAFAGRPQDWVASTACMPPGSRRATSRGAGRAARHR